MDNYIKLNNMNESINSNTSTEVNAKELLLLLEKEILSHYNDLINYGHSSENLVSEIIDKMARIACDKQILARYTNWTRYGPEIEKLKTHLLYAMLELFDSHTEFQNLANTMPYQARNNIINICVAAYLSKWLQNDINAKQTIHSYAFKGFCTIDKQWDAPSKHSDLSRRSYLQRNARKFEDNINLRHEQSVREKIKIKPRESFQKHQKKLFKISTETHQHHSPNGGKLYDFLSLYTIDHLIPSEFYQLLYYKKNLLTATSNKDKNYALRNAYKSYFDHIYNARFDNIQESSFLYNQMANNINRFNQNKALIYTISTLSIYNFELSHNIMTAALLAQYIENIHMGILDDNSFKDLMSMIYICYGRWKHYAPQDTAFTLPLPIEIHDFFIYQALHMILYAPSDAQPQMIKHCKNIIILTQCMLSIILRYYPVAQQPPFTEKDFEYTALFLKEEYPILEQHPSMSFAPPEEWSDNMLNNIRRFYENLEGNELEYGRSHFKKRTQEQNRKSKSST